ncbi:LIC_10450 family protein [Leptospira sp. GIMC2001]|uniref:LIC_10450 family protein n=1 Tax=Leptospira sp. GIMC2001 TaxID=1513297 RepID=UPI00234B395D|nr:hypothetical protein [Leptospira sp. GIMC2001]WCL49310.1 hypothetical protein O4O04_18780 [Leptospira sp. GIMC2001]
MSQENTDYIRVNSINEIDPNKLSLSFVGKKFIDKDNNRFSIRFNRETRKMEVVKIMIRSGGKIQEDNSLRAWEESKEIDKPLQDYIKPDTQVTKQSLETPNIHESSSPHDSKKQLDSKKNSQSASIPSQSTDKSKDNKDDFNFSGIDLDISLEDFGSPVTPSRTETSQENLEIQETRSQSSKPEENYDDKKGVNEKSTSASSEIKTKAIKPEEEKNKIEALMKSIEEAKTRIQSVLNNIKSSRIFEITGDPSENKNIIGNLTREFDVEVFQPLEKISNYLKELTSYPRAINYYTAKFEKSKRDDLSLAVNDKDKLALVMRWEMQEGFTSLLGKFKALSHSLLDVFNLKTETHVKQLQYQNQLMFTDAKNATIFCSQDIEKLIKDVENWKYETN